MENGQFQGSKTIPAGFGTVAGAIAYLEGLRLPLTFTESREYLSRVWQRTNLLSLYRHYFPLEWASAGAGVVTSVSDRSEGASRVVRTSLSFGEVERTAREREPYSPKEIEFLGLVDQKLFPIYLDYYLEGEEREETIYIPNFGPDWWGMEWDDLHGGWQILLQLTGHLEVGRFKDVEDCHQAALAEIFMTLQASQVDWAKLEERCRTQKEPLASLPLAFEMLEHDTGNIFLDPTDETPADNLEWTVTDIDFLIQQSEQAQTMLDKTNKLLDWLTTSPAHLQEVINLWNECLTTRSQPQLQLQTQLQPQFQVLLQTHSQLQPEATILPGR